MAVKKNKTKNSTDDSSHSPRQPSFSAHIYKNKTISCSGTKISYAKIPWVFFFLEVT